MTSVSGSGVLRSLMRSLPLAISLLFVSSGCSREEALKPTALRAIKTHVVASSTQALTRSFSGVVQACKRSSLSFQVGGRIEKLPVEIGDTVREGQILAELDPAPFELRVRQAEADVQAARAQLAEREKRFASEQRLLPKGATTQAEFDQMEAALAAAKSQLDIAESALRLAKRDLSHTKLSAPIPGRIARKHLQNYSQIAPGVSVLELDGEGGFEASTAIPEGFAAKVGDQVEVLLKSDGGAKIQGVIAQIGSRSEMGSTMPVLVRLSNAPQGLRTGTAAEIRMQEPGSAEQILAPVAGIIPGASPNTGFVFVFDPKKGAVSKRSIQLGNPQGDSFIVLSGLAVGETMAAAGVSFLTDGQAVRVWSGADHVRQTSQQP